MKGRWLLVGVSAAALLPVIGRRGTWWQVVWFDTVGWVYAPFVEIREGDLNNVPEV